MIALHKTKKIKQQKETLKMHRKFLKAFLLAIVCSLAFITPSIYADGEMADASWGFTPGDASTVGGWYVGSVADLQGRVSENTPFEVVEALAGADPNAQAFAYINPETGMIENVDSAISQLGKTQDGVNFSKDMVLENGLTFEQNLQLIQDALNIPIEELAVLTLETLNDLGKLAQKAQAAAAGCSCCGCPGAYSIPHEAPNSYTSSVEIKPPCETGLCETEFDINAGFVHSFEFVPACMGGVCATGAMNPPIVYDACFAPLGGGCTSVATSKYPQTAHFLETHSFIPHCHIEFVSCNCTEDGGCDTCPICICDGCTEVVDWSFTGNTGEATATSTASVINPYNYQNEAKSDPPAKEEVFTGEKTDIGGSVTNKAPKGNSDKYTHTFTNKRTIVRLIEFVVAPEKNPSVEGSNSSPADPCSFFAGKMGDGAVWDCNTAWEETRGNGLRPGETVSKRLTRNIPDNKPIGSKYCYAIGAWTSDSGADGMGEPPSSVWIISGASCTTISKKPNFQVWNSGLYTGGSVSTTLSPKNPGIGFGDSSDGIRTFGSWEEQLAIIGRDTRGFASGSAIAYGDYRFALTGGKAGSASTSQISPLTISNNNPSAIGHSGVNAEATAYTIIDRLQARYPTSEEVSNIPTTVLNKGDVKVYHSSGDINITGNICYGPCSVPAAQQTTTLRQQNLSTDAISDLPQTIIIADGNINISGDVERIDAWLITKTGIIDTCSTFRPKTTEAGYNNGFGGGRDTGGCNRQLIVNGPVIAKNLALNRTAGAYSTYDKDNIAAAYGGYSSYEEGADVRDQNLANDGSITPAEIFNLRPDTYLWAYSQAQEFTEAVVTYSRELAPRL